MRRTAALQPAPSSRRWPLSSELRGQLEERLLRVLRGRVDRDAPDALRVWFTHLLGLRERQFREQLLAERLSRFDTHLGFSLLCALLDLAATKDARGRQLLLDLTATRPLAEALGYERTRSIYSLARARGREDVTRLLLSPAGQLQRVPASHAASRENRHMQDASLGWRKKLARGNDRMKLDRLVFDQNPAVTRLLLDNPRIVERDVVRIAAMRPTNPDCLVAVFQSRKWRSRYPVKVALACNPYSPIDVALACLPQLMRQNLRYVAENEKLAAELRQAASELLNHRPGQVSPPRS